MDIEGQLKTIYCRYINGVKYCVWYYGNNNDKLADMELKQKEKELNANNETSRSFS